MKLNRRMFFGAGAGAALAGPKMAAGLVDRIGGFGPGEATDSGSYGLLSNAKVVSEGDWRINRVAELKRIITGENTDEKDRRRENKRMVINYLEQVDRHRLDSLRSISMGRKVAMLAEAEASRQRRWRVMEAEWEIERLEAEMLKFPWES